MRTPSPCFRIPSYTLAALGAVALFGTTAQAADLGPSYLPPLTVPVDTWTGFSFAAGGGLGILTADVNGRASRDDRFCVEDGGNGNGECLPSFVPDPNVFISQSHQLNVQDLSGDGIFGTIQAAYDWQFAPRWVGGLFVDADLYDIDGHAKQRSSVSTGGINFGSPYGNEFDFTLGDATLDAKVGIDWSISVGGRLGWLATPDTLLYVLGAYTHAELDNARFEVNITDPAHPMTLSPIDTHYLFKLSNEVDGFSAGLGSEVRLGGGWSLKGEYRFTWLDGETKHASSETFQCRDTCIEGDTDLGRRVRDNAAIDMDFGLHTFRGLLAYRF